jgi:hypothetical protein
MLSYLRYLTDSDAQQYVRPENSQLERQPSALEYSSHNDDDDDIERSEYGNLSLDLTNNNLEPSAGKAIHTSSPNSRSTTTSSMTSNSTATIKQIANELYASTLASSHSQSSIGMPSLSLSSSSTAGGGGSGAGFTLGGDQLGLITSNSSSSNLSALTNGNCQVNQSNAGINNWSQQHEQEQIVHDLERRVTELTDQLAYVTEDNGELIAKLNHSSGENTYLINR